MRDVRLCIGAVEFLHEYDCIMVMRLYNSLGVILMDGVKNKPSAVNELGVDECSRSRHGGGGRPHVLGGNNLGDEGGPHGLGPYRASLHGLSGSANGELLGTDDLSGVPGEVQSYGIFSSTGNLITWCSSQVAALEILRDLVKEEPGEADEIAAIPVTETGRPCGKAILASDVATRRGVEEDR